MQTTVVDEQGQPLVVYHGTKDRFDSFERAKTSDGGFHFGTRDQAIMRSGRSGFLIKALLEIRNPRRSKDLGGSWKKKIESAKGAGHDGIVYLNRYEGISRATVTRAYEERKDLDLVTDAEFHKYAPETRDSYIAFYPAQIRIISVEEI